MAIGPDSPNDAKHHHLRALFRQHDAKLVEHSPGKVSIDHVQQAKCRRILEAEFERLYGEPSRDGALEAILVNAWHEERELAGQRYSHTMQEWLWPDGSPVDSSRGHR